MKKWQVMFRNEVYGETEAFEFDEALSEPEEIRKERTMMLNELNHIHSDLLPGEVRFHLVDAE
jgi:hypothetical protein